jgi:short-chain fatty acids transporter
VIGLPLLNRAMQPRQCAKVADPSKLVESHTEQPERETPAQRLDDSRILGLALVAMAAIYLFYHFSTKGFVLGLDVVIAIFLFCGLLLHGTSERYMRACGCKRAWYWRHRSAVPLLCRDHGHDDGR